ncbi:putative reverse transcriptase domain-containing protein [Tanacetum coccineum]
MSWEDIKTLAREEFCPSNEMQKLETGLWNHAMVRAGHAAYTDRFHELARLVPHLVTPEGKRIERNGSIKKNPEKRGNGGEPSKDKNVRDDNKRTRTENAFATTTNPVGRENTGTVPKCTICSTYHPPGAPYRTCFNCNRLSDFAKDCRMVPRNRTGVNHQKQVVAIDEVQGHKNQGNQARGRAFMLGAKEAHQDSNIMTGMDWLSDQKAEIICHEKVVRIPLLDGKVLRVLGENVRQLMSAKTKEKKQEEIVIELILRAMPVVKFPYCLAPSKLEELSDQLRELQDKEVQFLGHVINGDGIHVDPSKIEAIKNWKALRTPSEDKLCNAPILALLDGSEDFVVYCDASGLGLGCVLMQRGLQKGLDEMIELRNDGALYYLDRMGVPLKGDVRTLIMDEAHKSKYSVHPGANKMYSNLKDSVRCAPFEALYVRKCRYPIMWAEVGEGQLLGPKLVQETTKSISQIKDRLKAARDRQKSVVRFGKKGKFAPRFVGPFENIEKVGPVAYQLDLLGELNGVHDTFHVSNFKKCLADPTIQVPLDEIQVDAKLNFVEEPVKILESKIKKLKRSRISIVKVRWNSKRRPEFTWERKDQMKLKYPHLFSADK